MLEDFVKNDELVSGDVDDVHFDLESQSDIESKKRDLATAVVVKKYQSHIFVERAINNQRKTHAIVRNVGGDQFGNYMSEAGSFDLLSAEDEVELFGLIEKGLDLALSLESLDNLTPEQTQTLLEFTAARQVIMNTNLRLVINIAKKYFKFSPVMPQMDLIQEGNLGLTAAITRFSVDKGLKFSTYATWWVRQQITRSIADKARIIRVPVHMHEKAYKVMTKVEENRKELGRDLTDDEIESVSGLPLKKYHEMLTWGKMALPSIDRLVGDDDADTVLGDFVEDPNSNMDREIGDMSDRDELSKILAHSGLNEREKFILGLRNGLDTSTFGDFVVSTKKGQISYSDGLSVMESTKGLTLEEVGDLLGITRERVRQIEKNGLNVLRAQMAKRSMVS